MRENRKWKSVKRNLLFLAVILAGALIAVYGENRYISYAGFLLVLFTWMIVQFVGMIRLEKGRCLLKEYSF